MDEGNGVEGVIVVCSIGRHEMASNEFWWLLVQCGTVGNRCDFQIPTVSVASTNKTNTNLSLDSQISASFADCLASYYLKELFKKKYISMAMFA